jgi:hypothetical protein
MKVNGRRLARIARRFAWVPLTCGLVALASCGGGGASSSSSGGGLTEPAPVTPPALATTKFATLNNFILDPVVPDNGMPDSPGGQQTIGRINVGVDVDGNAIEAVDEQDVRYYEGKYYLYGASFSCGSFNYASGTMTSPQIPTSPASNYRWCGMATYSSDDLMNWKFLKYENVWTPEGEIVPIKKPRVVYSKKTGLYTMWFLSDTRRTGIPLGGEVYRIVQSTSPHGPWGPVSKPTSLMDPTLNNIGPDFAINDGPDGTAWLVNSHNGIKVFQMNEERTGVLEEYPLQLATGTIGGGIGIHYYNGWWYVTGSGGCGNCLGSNMQYVMAKDPRGPWISPDTGTADVPVRPAVLADDVGRSQVHGVSMLPGLDGVPRALIPSTHYRSSPTGAPLTTLSQPGDNNLALAGHFYFPLSYAADGKILPLKLQASEKFELAREVVADVPPTYEAVLSVTSTKSVVQSWTVPPGQVLAAIMPAVFQRTPDLSTFGHARGLPPAQDPHVNAPLFARLDLPDGNSYDWTIDPRTVQWAPRQIALNLPKALRVGGKVTLTLSTTATNGGYGVAVGNKSNRLPAGEYAEVSGGTKTPMPKAEMLMKVSAEALGAPRITEQPRSLRVAAGGTVGFLVAAEGVGVGYQWSKNGQVILSPAGNDTTAPTLRIQGVTTADSGTYTVTVFNQVGSVTSIPVTLEVTP